MSGLGPTLAAAPTVRERREVQLASDDRPLIGLTTYQGPISHGRTDEVATFLPSSYVDAVERAGGQAVLVPPSRTDPGAALARLDGLVTTGGPDIDPARYGAAPHPKTGRPREERDEWETALCRASLDAGSPLLAICRGVQVLNVALGGTLHQHLPEVPGRSDHRRPGGEPGTTTITVHAGTTMAAILGPATEGICRHHQAIDRLGEGLRAVGFSADGTVEAVEVAGAPFAIGVQWHPEDNPGDGRLFEALVAAGRRYRTGLQA
jgi:putative glutamine amidotransferase